MRKAEKELGTIQLQKINHGQREDTKRQKSLGVDVYREKNHRSEEEWCVVSDLEKI